MFFRQRNCGGEKHVMWVTWTKKINNTFISLQAPLPPCFYHVAYYMNKLCLGLFFPLLNKLPIWMENVLAPVDVKSCYKWHLSLSLSSLWSRNFRQIKAVKSVAGFCALIMINEISLFFKYLIVHVWFFFISKSGVNFLQSASVSHKNRALLAKRSGCDEQMAATASFFIISIPPRAYLSKLVLGEYLQYIYCCTYNRFFCRHVLKAKLVLFLSVLLFHVFLTWQLAIIIQDQPEAETALLVSHKSP